MTDFIAACFGFIALIMFIVSFRFMAQGWSAAKELDEFQQRANKQYGGNVEVVRRTVTKGVHPEMVDVKNGDELLVVKFDDEETPKDPLLSDLEARINVLREENEDKDDEEGGLVVRR